MNKNRLLAFFSASLLLAGCGGSPTIALKNSNALSFLRSAAVVLPVVNFATVDPGIYRGGQPSDEAMSLLSKEKFKTIISLQNPGFPQERGAIAHEKEQAKSLGIEWLNIPLPVKGDPPMDMVNQLLKLAHDPNHQPIYIHCTHGRDRTGTMVAAYRITYDGYSGQQALTEMQGFGFKKENYPDFAKFVLNYHPLVKTETLCNP